MSSEQFREFFCSCHTHILDHQWHVSTSLPSKPRPTACCQMSFVHKADKRARYRWEDEEGGSKRGGVAGAQSYSSVLAVWAGGVGLSPSLPPLRSKEWAAHIKHTHTYTHAVWSWGETCQETGRTRSWVARTYHPGQWGTSKMKSCREWRHQGGLLGSDGWLRQTETDRL